MCYNGLVNDLKGEFQMGYNAHDYMCDSYDSCLDCPAGAWKNDEVVCAFSLVEDAQDQYKKECPSLFVKKEWQG